jgi:signal transduction histidine kinase
VEDSGRGIAPHELDSIFDEFYRAGSNVSDNEGTGLGLAISKKIARAVGGTIQVESQLGVGSTFTFTCPVKPVSVTKGEPA